MRHDGVQGAAALGLGDRLLVDLHDGPEGGAGFVDKIDANPLMKGWGVLNGETNCGDHTVKRMLSEAKDLNMFFSAGTTSANVRAGRLKGRTGSFCMERCGYNEGGLNDQGMAFFLPNGTWLQPPGHVHAMVAETYTQAPLGLGVVLDHHCPFYLEDGHYSAQVRCLWTAMFHLRDPHFICCEVASLYRVYSSSQVP